MKISTSLITFRIDIDFEECNVDTVYTEMMAAGVITPVTPFAIAFGKGKIPFHEPNNKTPVKVSVDKALMSLLEGNMNKNCEFPELKRLGVEVIETNGLMMGTCSLICEVEKEKFSFEVIEKVEQIVKKVFKNYVRYYKENTSRIERALGNPVEMPRQINNSAEMPLFTALPE